MQAIYAASAPKSATLAPTNVESTTKTIARNVRINVNVARRNAKKWQQSPFEIKLKTD
jgi:hypothetical protein